MNKKTVSILSTVGAIVLGLVLFLISQGNIKKAEKQNEIFADNFTELMKITEEIVDSYRAGGMPKALAFVRDNKERAANAVANLRGVCDYFEKVNVPKKLKAKLENVRAGIPDMRMFLDKYENMFRGVMLESEFKGYVSEMSNAASALKEDGNFIIAEQEFIRELSRLRRESSRYNRFMWL